MKKLIAAAVLGSLALAAQETPPSAEAILARFVEVTGGKAAYEKQRNSVSTGTIEVVGHGLTGTLTSYEAAPYFSYTTGDLGGAGKIESGTNADTAWESSAIMGPRVLDGEEKTIALRKARFNAPIYWREMYPKVQTAGRADVEGDDCWKVEATPAVGPVETLFFSKKTGLLLEESGIHVTQMGKIPVEEYFSDYRDVNGVKTPFRSKQKFAGQEIHMVFSEVKANVDIPAGRFALPSDIQALLNKAKPAAESAQPEKPSGPGGGKLTVYMGGNAVAHETYSFAAADGKFTWTGSGKAHLGPMEAVIEEFRIVTDEKYRPLEASARGKLGQITMAVTTKFADGKAVSEIATPQGPKTKEDAVSPDAFVVSQNLPLFPLGILARKVSFANGEPQQFHGYILGQKEVPVTVRYLGKETVEFAAKSAELNRLSGEANFQQGQAIAVEMWVTDDRGIVKLSVPSQHLEAYQEGYGPKPTPPPAVPADPAAPKP